MDKTHVLVNGKIVASGDASLVDEINEHGFERFWKHKEVDDLNE